MKNRVFLHTALIVMACLLMLPTSLPAYSAKPDLTAAGAIATLKADSSSSPVYAETYNLGPTGLRGWIYIDRNNMGQEGLITDQSRQILVTVASAPGSAVLAVDDVILGAMAASTGSVPLFTGDCRKAFGAAIGEAEKTGAGTLRVKRWRAGTTTDENIAITIMGDYAATAPYNCPKSALILANAITKLNQESLATEWHDAVRGLALLAAVKPADANYATVQTKLQNLAHSMAPANLALTGCDTWKWGYFGVFLSEYYLRTVADGSPDASVLHGINEYTVALAKGQSKYGTFGHGGAEQHADGSLHGSISWYGPVNSAGLVANLAIVLGKKALLAGGMALDPEIDPAIERGSRFFAYFVNKGGIPYGEHEPWSGGHASNGKDAMAAVMFGLQDNRPVETEYFTRMSVAGWVGREYGHTGQGFSYIWSALGAAMGGDAAVVAHLNQVRWHLDLERRTDGSFVYDGGEQYGANTTSTYLGSSSYSGLSPNACFVLTYALPLKRLYITGRNANPANTLDAAKVANEIAAATYERDCPAYSVATLMTALSEYDPVVRHDAAAELAKRTLTTAEENALIALITNGTLSADANVRQGACETLGIRKTTGALAALSQRLSDTDQWVRGKASNALRNFGSAASGQITPMLTAFAANATDPDVIVWDDPIQIANGYLADTLFQALAANTNALSGTARTTVLYPALRAGLKQPDGMARMYMGDFIKNRLTLADVQAVAPSLVAAAAERSPADRMFSDVIRYAALQTLAKYKIEEGIPLCLVVKEQTWHGDDWVPFDLLTGTYRGAAKDALPTLYKWQQHIPQFAADGSIGGCCPTRLASITDKIATTIAAIENDAAPPTLVNFKTLTASANPAVVTLPTTSTILTPVLVDLDTGTPNFVWSKVSGPGSVSFNPGAMSANANCTATFNTPGTYVLRVTAVDRSILDFRKWITYSLGYFDFQTYNEILAAVSANLTVTVVADPNRAPLPQNQSLTIPLNTALSVTLAATDPDGDAMTYSVVTSPVHGSLTGTAPSLLYTPTAGYTGADSFTFKANDGKVDSAVAMVAIDVGGSGNRRPSAVNQSVTTAEDSTKAITLSGTDPDSDPLTYDIVTWPVHGALIGTAPNLTYLPAANFPAGNSNGSDSFTFTVRDASLTSAMATVSITVTPVNDPPLALAQSLNVSTASVNPITLTGLDPENYALSFAVMSNPGHGTLSGTAPNLSYQPAANFHGPDSFTFKVTDSEGAASSTATVSITVINDPPLANPQVVELPPNTSKAVTLTGSDNCNDALTYSVLTQPAHGVLTGTAPNLTYTPATDYTGTDSFTFKTHDGVSDSPAVVISLNVAQWQTWTNVAAGNWSVGASWSGGTAPAAGGSPTALLVFNTSPYSAASANDLAVTFQLNRLNLGSSLPALTLSGNPLSFSLNSAALPQVNQSSANAVTLSNSITLAASATLGGTGAGALTLSGVISGTGGLTKTNSGILTLSSPTTTNSYSGGTSVTAGTLVLDLKRTNLGTGAVTLAGGTTFYTTNFEGNSSGGGISNTFNLSGGLVTLWTAKDIWLSGSVTGSGGLVITGSGRTPGVMLAGAKTFSGGVILSPANGENPTVAIDNINSLGTGTLRSELTSTNIAGNLEARAAVTTSPGVANPIELAPACRLVVKADGSSNLWLSGVISGEGSLVKIGTATLTLSGANTYGGSTTVSAGILACSSAASLGQGALAISSGAKIALNFTGTRTLTALSFAGAAQPNGIYSAATSPTYISGTGTLTVAPATSTTLDLTGGVLPSSPGDPLTFTATVTGSTPTGNVTFYAGVSLLGTSALNASFQASVTTSSLAAGNHNITAVYAGNTNNGASSSAVLAIQVLGAPAPPTNLAAMAGNNLAGLTWSASSGASGYFVKRGSVSGGPYTTLGTASGTSYSDTSALNGTTYYYVVSATNNAGEGPNSGQVSATPAPPLPSTTTLASSLGTTGVYGATVTFTATVAVTGGPATGSVVFKDGATVLGSGTLSAGQANYATSTLAAGSHSITATYSGSLAFEASSSGAFAFTVNKKSVTISGVTASNKTYDGSTAATLTGGSVTGVINGDTVTLVAGTGTFASATVGTWPVTVSGYALSGAGAGNYVLAAQPIVPDASITSVVGVVFSTKSLSTASSATGAEILNTGTLITANHVGNGTQSNITLTNGLTFGTSVSHLVSGWDPHNSSNTGVATISNPAFNTLINSRWWVAYTDSRSNMTISGLVVGNTYRLQLISCSPNSGTVAVEGSAESTWSGNNSVFTAIWVAGDTTLNMQYSRKQQASVGGQGGEVSFNGYALHDITPPSSAKDITSFTFPTYGAATIAGNNISLTVPSGTPVTAMAPTYTVSLNATGAPVSGSTRNFTTPLTYTITGQDLTTNIYTVTVTPLAQPGNLVATPGGNTVGLTWSAANGATGYNVKRATVSGGPYSLIGTSGVTSYTDGTAANGTTYYYVVSATNGAMESANSSQASALPSAVPSTTTLASSLGATGVYGSVTFTATVTAGASGTVTFWDGASVLWTGTLASGQATFTTSTLAMGGHSITATYEGDTTYASSSSAAFSYTVSAKPVTITGITAGNKVYDGNNAAVLTGGALSGVINGDTVTVTVGSGSFASANAGTWAVTATSYALGGTHAGNYVLAAQPTVPNATISARPVLLTGTRVYDGTTSAAASALSVSNKVSGDDLSLTGSATLAAKDVGLQAILGGALTPVRVANAVGAVAGTAVSNFNVTVTAPTSGNTLVAVIATRKTGANAVSGITNTGTPLNWQRAAQSTTSTTSTTTEIWYAPVMSGAGTTLTVTLSSTFFAAAVVGEYSGILSANALDVFTGNSNSSNSTAATTGTTATTTQANELWIGGIGVRSSAYALTLGTSSNSFGFITTANASSGSTTAGSNARVFALEKMVTATGTAGSGGTVSTSSRWSGAIATFKAALSLGGTAAGNYTLIGASGAVEVTAKPLVLTGATAVTSKTYDGLTAATLTGGALPVTETAGTGTTGDGKPYSGDTVSLVLSGTFDTKDVAAGKTVTSTSSLTGTHADNYSLTQPTGLTGGITAKVLTLTGTTTVTAKSYDGLVAATLTGGALRGAEAAGAGSTLDGTPYIDDAVSLTLSGTFDTKDAGTGKPVTSTSDLAGAQAGNYSLTQPTGLTGTIASADLTVTANNQGKIYGQTVAFGGGSTQFTNGSLQNGETIGSVTLACGGGAAAAGLASYPITPSAATGGTFNSNNYAISYVDGFLTVSPAGQTLSFAPLAARTYGDAPFDLTASADSGLAVDYVSSDPGVASVLGGTVTIHKAGSTTLTASQPGDANHSAATPVGQGLTINPAQQILTFAPLAARTYGDAPFDLTASASSGLAVVYVSSDPGVASVLGSTVTIHKAGNTTLTASQPGDANHNAATPVGQGLTINPAMTSFEVWTHDSAQGLTVGMNDGPTDDPDHDGIPNLLEFALGGKPMESSRSVLPVLTIAGGVWAFEYDRNEQAQPSTTQVVEYGSDLSGWTPLIIPESSAGPVTITPGSTSSHIKVNIPNPGAKTFVRLKVTQ